MHPLQLSATRAEMAWEGQRLRDEAGRMRDELQALGTQLRDSRDQV